jgi:glyoxalase family protein
MSINGLHHITAVTSVAQHNIEFYTQVLGLRLVKKTVNQDDVRAYHLYYGDRIGSPGTTLTFFDWPLTPRNIPGPGAAVNIGFRIPSEAALNWWQEHLTTHQVKHGEPILINGHNTLFFSDIEGQQMSLVVDEVAPFAGEHWPESPIPQEYALQGFNHVTLSLRDNRHSGPFLINVLGYQQTATYPNPADPTETVYVYTLGEGGPGKELHLLEQPHKPYIRAGWGGIHHVAFRVPDDAAQRVWHQRIQETGLNVSDVIDRFYFHSIYFHIPGGILFEIATDGPGFATDEPVETLGQSLVLPPFLEKHRSFIEQGLTPLT